jgi:fatty-acyl-CoA synthase
MVPRAKAGWSTGGRTMQGLMQDIPLSLTQHFERAERLFAKKWVITSTPRGRERRTYGEWADRTRRLATVLDDLGVSADGRVATFAWNSSRHLELYFAPPCSGRVVHTLNLRLFPDQLTYIVNHAEDEVLFVDNSVSRLIWPLMSTFSTLRHVVLMDDCGTPFPDAPPGVELHDYETLLAAAAPADLAPIADENQAAAMAYTSGTTGNPKGVVYSHRSMVLHTLAATMADGIGVRESDVLLPVVPMFHANAWGLAHAGVAVGATLVMPGPDLSPPSIAALIEEERVTVAAGVPTIWMGVLPELKGRDLSALRAIPCGGSAVPRALSEAYREQTGLPIMQAWGMTETSPVATTCVLKSYLVENASTDALAALRTTVGLPQLGVELRISDPETGALLPWDGQSRGELQARGPWIARTYYHDERANESFTVDGWLRTGDIATIDPEGYVSLVDRTKDLVKSGGEWISSVELENEIMAHPAVREAAVIGVPHPKWVERPLACVVLREGEYLTAAELREFLAPRVAKWWLPDDVVCIDEIPKTSVGKFSKKTLRDRFADHQLPPS